MSDMKTVRIIRDFSHKGARYFEGETRKVTREECGLFCGVGWAEDVDGEVATGEPDTGPKELEVHSVRMGVTSEKING